MRKLLPLSDVAIIKPFDCGDDYLNNFLYEKAMACEQEYLTKTFVYEDEEYTIAYISLLADKMSNTLIPKNIWRKLRRRINSSQHVAFRFLTVDAYKSAQPFYEKNDFVKLVNDIDPSKNTVPMYVDLKEISIF